VNPDTNSLGPVPANWFSLCVEYEGHGRAEFIDPKGSVEGPATARFDEYGECKTGWSARGRGWWTWAGSNSRPHGCKASVGSLNRS
jgi:hypothetical protein